MPRPRNTKPEAQQSEQASQIIYGRPYVSTPDANRLFRKKYKRKDVGANEDNMLDVFLRTMEHLTSVQQSFGFEDVAVLLRVYQYPGNEVKELFDAWINEMERWGKVEAVSASCYDTPVYLFH